MAATDPTGARLRDFDVPVILPRIAFLELPVAADEDEPAAGPPVSTTTCATPAAPPATDAAPVAAGPAVATTSKPAPKVALKLPPASTHRRAVLARDGLTFSVTSDKPVSDVEVRLVELVAKGQRRPLGVALTIPPGKTAAKVRVRPTPFARAKLAAKGARRVRAVAIVTAQDGTVGQAQAEFLLR